MPYAVAIEFSLNPDTVDDAARAIRDMLETTRNFDGNESTEVLIDTDDNTRWVISERWASADAYAKYRDYRSGEGKVTGLAPHVLSSTRRTFEVRGTDS
ncbi:hypothetical protein GCM10023094_11420 [Rhodococcus olei]|uniref:ABM domain-containing protein n=1 Tax=Rhodococcus olei TaxID=2161675 RepID=A0ABP8NZB9_9NOCA